MSNTKVAQDGITLPTPSSPYAICGGITKVRCSPTHIPLTPSSQPWITCPTPKVNSKGLFRSLEESNFCPVVNFPV